MVYVVEYRICGGCDKRKPDVDFYKTIKDICKMCRDEYMREQRQRTKEDEENAAIKRDQVIRKLRKITATQTVDIEKMVSEIKYMEKRMVNMEIRLGDLTPPRKKTGLKIAYK